ncbi:DNA-binding protein (plasmid) [Streptomyces sp. NBC_01343]|uniref:DNA-binding protein n=1 Tax=Streptomyces sp. NBC_01343 TaxID=2903832 RepID=UPI002E15C0C5|nr:DNA-binding protein [Streptomyces sp. NBC_01343]
MIPYGRLAFTLDDVAARAGVSLSTWRRQHHAAFTAAVKPLPGSTRPLLYDAAQVDAHLNGQPVPALPEEPHGQDLLTDAETGAVAGLSASTIRADATTGLIDPGTELHGRRWWTRAAAEARAGRPAQYKGRTPGAKDRAPRRTAPDARVPEVAAALAAAENGTGPAVTAAALAARYGVSTRTAERLVARARTHTA